MHFRRPILALIIAGLSAATPPALADEPAGAAPAAEATTQKFGPYEALVYDAELLAGVKVDEKGDVFLMFQPGKTDTQVTIKISMQKDAGYRKWFTGDEVLVALENSTGRSPGVWSDRVQTTANYIEYWAGGKRFLHLKKTGS
ncbi:MAG: hypothetical protein ABII82_08590 [Verrucomicrobiota bacterium]